jgi:hypothetical protein
VKEAEFTHDWIIHDPQGLNGTITGRYSETIS